MVITLDRLVIRHAPGQSLDYLSGKENKTQEDTINMKGTEQNARLLIHVTTVAHKPAQHEVWV